MAQDRNGNNHKAAGRPDGGQFDRKAGQGADDDLAAGDGRLPMPTAGELSRVADAIGTDADALMLQLPDGTVAGCYRTDGPIKGPLPDGWHVYDTMESDEGWDEDEDDWTDLAAPTITIDDQPVAHIVNQGPKLVTRHDLSGVDRGFDEDHWWMDGHTLGGDLELVRNEFEWRGSIAADCGLDPDDLDDPDVFNEAAVDFLMADSEKAADEAGYTRDGANALLYMAGRLYDKDMDRDFRVPMTTLGDDIDRLTGGRGLDDPEMRAAAERGGYKPGDRYIMFNEDGDLVGLNDDQARLAAWTNRHAILGAARREAGAWDAMHVHSFLRSDRDWTAWDDWDRPETFSLSNLEPGTYYYGLKVTNDQDAANLAKYVGEKDGGLVYEAPKRVKSESFDIVRVTSSRRNAATVTGTVKHVDDILHVDGTLPKGSSYKVEAWRVENGKAVEKVSESKTHVLDHDTTGDIQVNDVPAPTKAGTYQFRHYVWTPDTLGGDPSVTDAMAVIDPDATTGYKYAKRHLLADGDSDESERFEMVSIDTYVAKTNNVKTYKGKHYVDVTDGADVYDHAEITGNLPAGYRLGFTLYKEGRSEAADVAVATIPPTNLTEASKELDSATVHLTEPGTYYWVYSFSGADGQTWIDGDGSPELKELISKHRIPDETFNAVRVTTTTAKWTSKGGETVDVARIEGCLPDDATMNFELHDYQTGDKVAETGETSLAKLGYKPCEQGGDEVQTVESPKVTLPDAADHYFVESVKFGSDEFHRGNDKVSHESTRTIDATTDTSVEYTLGTAVADHADLLNIRYVGKDGKDIRDDLTGPLTASWELYRQADGDDASKDEKVADVDKDGVALESGQTEVESSPYKPDGTGLYYYVITIRDENGDVVKRGAAREPSESFRIIKAESKTDRVVSEGTKVRDRVTISGPVAEGTMVSWTLMKYGEGSADTDSVVKRYDTPADGAVLVTAKQAAEAAKSKTVINGPEFEGGKAGENYYWVFSLSSSARDGETGEPLKPKGAADTSHLATNSIAAIDAEVDGDGQEPQVDIQRFMTDRSRVEDESFNTVKVTTMASSHDATVGDKVHDTAIITGDIPNDGYCVSFEYWKRNDGDVRNDHLNDTSECVAVPAHATTVDSPERTVVEPGEHYYRERLTERGNGREVSYGEARVKGETVLVRLAPTGVAAAGAAGAMLAVAGLGMTLGLASRRRRHVGAHARV